MTTPEDPSIHRPVNPADIAEFSNFLAPLSGGRPASNQDALVYGRTHAKFTDGEWPQIVARGRFGEISRFSQQVAANITEHQDMTLPRVFGMHMLVCLHATVYKEESHRPPVMHSGDRAGFFLMQFAGQLAMQTPQGSFRDAAEPFELARSFRGPASTVSARSDEDSVWVNMKLSVMAERLALRRHVGSMTRSEQPFTVDDTEAMRTNNDDLLFELQRLKYHVVPRTLVEDTQTVWSIGDTLSLHAQGVGYGARSRGSRKVTVSQWPFAILSASEHEPEIEEPCDFVLSAEPDQDPATEYAYRIGFLAKNGIVSADIFGSMPLVKFYEEANIPQNYEVLRQFILQQYFDIVVPESVVEEVAANTKLMLQRDPKEDRNNNIAHHDLLVPRIRKLRSFRRRKELDMIERADAQRMES